MILFSRLHFFEDPISKSSKDFFTNTSLGRLLNKQTAARQENRTVVQPAPVFLLRTRFFFPRIRLGDGRCSGQDGGKQRPGSRCYPMLYEQSSPRLLFLPLGMKEHAASSFPSSCDVSAPASLLLPAEVGGHGKKIWRRETEGRRRKRGSTRARSPFFLKKKIIPEW